MNRAVQVRATSVVHLRWEPTRDSMKNGSKLHEGAMAWSDAQVQVQGVTYYRLQSGWAPLLRQKGQNILEEVDWDTDWSKDSDRGWASADPRFPFECARRLPAACSVLQTMTFKCTESQNSHDGLEPLKTPDGKAGGACAKLR